MHCVEDSGVETIGCTSTKNLQQWPFGATVARYFPVVKALGSSPRMVDFKFLGLFVFFRNHNLLFYKYCFTCSSAFFLLVGFRFLFLASHGAVHVFL